MDIFEQLEFKLEKNIGIKKHAWKVRKWNITELSVWEKNRQSGPKKLTISDKKKVLPNAYADQILTPRRAKNRGPLPSARLSSFVKIWYYELTKAIWVSSFRRRDTKLDIFLTQTQRPW